MTQAAHRRPAPAIDTAGAVRTGVQALGELSMTAGALLLLFVVWQLWWTDVVANRSQAATTDELTELWDAAADPAVPAVAEPESPLADLPAEAVALVRVPAFGDDYVRPVLDGTTLGVLEEGIGHYDGTAGPGEVGNFALAGHRTTYGAPLKEIAVLEQGDPVVVETPESYFVYRVSEIDIVAPSDVGVIEPVPNEPGVAPTERLLTLTSCHPMYTARERYIVHAVLEAETPREAGEPDVLAGASAAGS